jgi:hypothetical protein
MRHLRRTVLAAFAVALLAAPAATAQKPQFDPGGAVVAPASGKLLGEAWARGLSAPIPDPYAGTCAPVGRGGTVVAGRLGDDGTATCKITQGTSVLVFWSFFCSDVFEGVSGEAAQRECAVAGDQTVRRSTSRSTAARPSRSATRDTKSSHHKGRCNWATAVDRSPSSLTDGQL